jgi:arylsulfatase A-like enzyme
MWTYQSHYPYFPSGESLNFKTGNFSKEKYLNSIRNADKTLQMLVEGLIKRNLLKSTLIVILGDHGEAFGKHNQTGHAGGIYEENLHIPFILINPELFKGERLSVLGGISDIAPTILSILQKEIPEVWQGENLFSENRRKRLYFFSPFSDYLFGFRENNLKFIYNATTGKHLLFDLATDPLELSDISKNHAEYVKEAKSVLNEWIRYQGEYVNSYLSKQLKN